MEKREAAVSPVVGVMLMLAVTIMIAAIVSATAGNFSGTEKKAPSAILDVTIYAAKDYGGYYVPTMTIKHVSGNVLQTKDLQIVTYYTVPGSGNISRGSITGEKSVTVDTASGNRDYGVLFISNGDNTPSDQTNWFGNASATFKPGDILITPAQYCNETPGEGEQQCNPSMKQLFPNVQFINGDTAGGSCSEIKGDRTGQFTAGRVVSVKIIHTPSGQIIFDKDVVIS
jgi:archaeal type IV pilus assembly protein PilA